VVGFVSPDGRDFSFVIETTEAKSDQTLALRTADATTQRPLHVWRTDALEQFIPQADLTPSNGTWTATLNPNCSYSLTTTAGQRKGFASSPPATPFPLPHLEDFDGCRLNGTARYLCDMGGAFEVVRREGGGQCLRQQVHRPGIDWANAGYAYAVIGDDSWHDIHVKVETSLESLPEDAQTRAGRFLGVLARWYPGSTWSHFATPQPAGYCLRLFGDGRWELTTARKILARGTTAPPGERWHTLALRCVSNRIAAELDGTTLADLRDSTYLRGLVGLSSGFHPARFDQLAVDNP
jgi:hypothetical protein